MATVVVVAAAAAAAWRKLRPLRSLSHDLGSLTSLFIRSVVVVVVWR